MAECSLSAVRPLMLHVLTEVESAAWTDTDIILPCMSSHIVHDPTRARAAERPRLSLTMTRACQTMHAWHTRIEYSSLIITSCSPEQIKACTYVPIYLELLLPRHIAPSVCCPVRMARHVAPAFTRLRGHCQCIRTVPKHVAPRQSRGSLLQGSPATVEALVKRMSKPGTTRISLPRRPLRLKPGVLKRGPAHALVLRAAPAGCTITSGNVMLPSGTVLLLAGRGAHFHGVKFTGTRWPAPASAPAPTMHHLPACPLCTHARQTMHLHLHLDRSVLRTMSRAHMCTGQGAAEALRLVRSAHRPLSMAPRPVVYVHVAADACLRCACCESHVAPLVSEPVA